VAGSQATTATATAHNVSRLPLIEGSISLQSGDFLFLGTNQLGGPKYYIVNGGLLR
jgi:hypothetical protein